MARAISEFSVGSSNWLHQALTCASSSGATTGWLSGASVLEPIS